MREFLIKSFRPAFTHDLNEALKSQWLTAEQIAAEQNRKFVDLIDHCRQHVPYYQERGNLSAVKSIDDIKALPILTKDLVNANSPELLAQNYSSRDRIQISTSGSTGKQFRGYFDKRNRMSWACTIRGDMWAGYRFGAKRVMLWNVPAHIPVGVKMRDAGRDLLFGQSTWLSVLNLSDEKLDKYRKTINRVKPDVIIAYTNALDVMADFLERNGIIIHNPKGIVGSSTMMHEYQRERIERVFGAKVHNRYGSVEFLHIAGNCEGRKSLHISCEHVYIEVVDENGKPCPAGTPGDILVTDLTNYAFPLIRYKIGDLGALSDKQCECGRGLPMLKELIGRAGSVTVGLNGMRVTAMFWIDLLKDKYLGIRQFQVRQDASKNFQLLFQTDKEFDHHDIKPIKKDIQNKFGRMTQISIQLLDKIPLAPGGKHRWIISEVSPYG